MGNPIRSLLFAVGHGEYLVQRAIPVFPHPQFSYFCPALKPLRILQVTNRIPWPLNDGGNIAVYNLTRYLHNAGHHVELACLNTSKHHQDPTVIQAVAAIHAVDIDTTVTAWGAFAAMFSSLPYNVARFLSQEFSELLQRLLQGDRFDLVQLEGSYLSLYIPAIQAVSKAPIILRSHNVEFQIWQRLATHEPNLFKRLYMKRLARGIRKFELDHLQDVDAIIPIASQDEKFYCASGFQKPMRTINGGVDTSTFQPQHPLEPNLKIGFLGSLEWMPNLNGLAWFVEEIWPMLRKANSKLELHVAGKNPPDHLQDWKVEGMTFHGMVPDAAAFMETCHFFIVPLHAGGGMRMKIIEAMAMGRCVVSTSIGAEGIDAQDNTEIVIADGTDAWIKRIQELLQAPERSLAIAQQAHSLAQGRFGLAAVGEQLETFYQEVLR